MQLITENTINSQKNQFRDPIPIIGDPRNLKKNGIRLGKVGFSNIYPDDFAILIAFRSLGYQLHHGGENRPSFSSGCEDIKIAGWFFQLIISSH